MDVFVKTQLLLCNCEKYIPLFEEQGYNEEKYKKIRMANLFKLIPEDDECSVEKIWENIVNLRSTDSSASSSVGSSSGSGSSSIKIKVEPSNTFGSNETCIFHDEVQLVHVIHRAPMNLVWPPAAASIKLEPSEDGNEATPPAPETSGTLGEGNFGDILNSEQTGAEDDTRIMIEGRTDNNNVSLSEPPVAVVENEDSPSDVRKDKSNARMILRKRRRLEVAKLPPKPKSSSAQKRRKANNILQQSSSIQQIHLKSKISLKYWKWGMYLHKESDIDLGQAIEIDNNMRYERLEISFEFHNLNELATFLQELSFSASKLKKVLRLEIVGLSEDIFVGQSQLVQLSSIEPKFFRHLKSLLFGFGFSDDTDSNLITHLLSICTSLQIFEVKRGIFGKLKDESLTFTIQIPKMSKLTAFRWAKDFSIPPFRFPKQPIEIDLEAEEDEASTFHHQRHHPLPFQIDFSNHQFKQLKEINVSAVLKMHDFSQFPKIKDFIEASPWSKFNCFQCGSSNTVNKVKFWDGIHDLKNYIEQTPSCFPNLGTLIIICPSVACLRSLIHVMSSTALKKLWIKIDYDFEDALVSALLDLPFNALTSRRNQAKLRELKKYKYWETFSKHIGIELPQPEENDDDNDDDGLDEMLSLQPRGIGSFKHLEILGIRRVRRYIRLPKNDLHWNDPKVEYFDQYWDLGKMVFPMQPLLNEFVKLKHILRQFSTSFVSEPEDSSKFQDLMGFNPSKIDLRGGSVKLDPVSQINTKRSSGLIKQEK